MAKSPFRGVYPNRKQPAEETNGWVHTKNAHGGEGQFFLGDGRLRCVFRSSASPYTDNTMTNTPIDYCRHNDRFAAASGVELIEMTAGRAVAQMAVAEQQQNSLGTVHGGALFTLAATAFFAASNAAGETAMGTNMNITCLKPAVAGVLRAEATEIARSRKLVHGTVRITDEKGDLVALFQGTAYIKGQPYPPAS
jgi:acyl-CoA thioesterase